MALTYLEMRKIEAEAKRLRDELLEIRQKAEKETRDLSRRETLRANEIILRANELQATLEGYRPGAAGDFDPRTAQGTPRLGDHGEDSTILLRPEQRLSDWVRDQRGGSGFGGDDFDAFSLGKIIRAAVTGDRRQLNEAERRAMAEGVDASGGFLIAEELSSTIIDLARASAVVFQAGAQTAPMKGNVLHLARLASGNAAAWKAENDPVSSSDQVWERLEFEAKTCVVEQILSRELYEDLTPEADQIIRGEIGKAIGLKLDLAVLEGAGSGAEPRGIVNTSGVNTVDTGTNGAAPGGFDEIVKADFAVRKNNGAAATAAVMHPRDAESYALLKDADGKPLVRPSEIASLPFLTTTQIKTDRTKGSSSNCSNMYVGDWKTVIVAVRPSLSIRFQVLSERYSSNLQVGLLAWLRADVGMARPEHMTKVTGVKPL